MATATITREGSLREAIEMAEGAGVDCFPVRVAWMHFDEQQDRRDFGLTISGTELARVEHLLGHVRTEIRRCGSSVDPVLEERARSLARELAAMEKNNQDVRERLEAHTEALGRARAEAETLTVAAVTAAVESLADRVRAIFAADPLLTDAPELVPAEVGALLRRALPLERFLTMRSQSTSVTVLGIIEAHDPDVARAAGAAA